MIARPGSAEGNGNRDRRAVRRRLLLWSALPVVLILCVAGKLLSLGLLAGQAAGAFAARDAAAVGTAAQALGLANVIEPHKAPFAAGDAHALAGEFTAARRMFEDALVRVPRESSDECVVRVNLSLAIEQIGDAQLREEGPASAAVLYGEALAVAEAAPAGCFAAGAAGEPGEQLAEAEGRLKEKLAAGQAAESPEGAQQDGPEGQESPDESQLEQLGDSARQAERERNNARERDEYLRDNDYAAGPDRPW